MRIYMSARLDEYVLPFLVLFGAFSECSFFRDMSPKHSTGTPCTGRGHRGGVQVVAIHLGDFLDSMSSELFSGICPSMELSIRAAKNCFSNVCERTFYGCREWRAYNRALWLGACMRQVASAAHSPPPLFFQSITNLRHE